MARKDPFQPVDDEARALARALIDAARHGALGVLSDGVPVVTLVSDLAPHTAALRAAPDASVMVGDVGRGDPLAHPRLTLQVRAAFLDKTESHVNAYLRAQPKAQLYIGFGDFHLVQLAATSVMLNGGFGKAYRLQPDDLKGQGQ